MKYYIALIFLACVLVSACDLAISPFDLSYGFIDGRCRYVVYGQSFPDNTALYPTLAKCEAAQGGSTTGLKDNNLACTKDSECKSGNCAWDVGNFYFCEPASGSSYVYISCYSDSCLSEKWMVRPGQTCEEIGFKSTKASTCYQPGQYCGNNKKEGVEECDGTNIGYTCVSYGTYIKIPYNRGTISCKNCIIDTSGCMFGTETGQSCTFNFQCSDEGICVNGECVDYTPECTKNSDCNTGEECQYGYCRLDTGSGGGAQACIDDCDSQYGMTDVDYYTCHAQCHDYGPLLGVILGVIIFLFILKVIFR